MTIHNEHKLEADVKSLREAHGSFMRGKKLGTFIESLVEKVIPDFYRRLDFSFFLFFFFFFFLLSFFFQYEFRFLKQGNLTHFWPVFLVAIKCGHCPEMVLGMLGGETINNISKIWIFM